MEGIPDEGNDGKVGSEASGGNEPTFPDEYYCSITRSIMTDPWSDKEGNTYEKDAILEWFKRSKTSPITRSPMTEEDLRPNRALKALMDQHSGIEEARLKVILDAQRYMAEHWNGERKEQPYDDPFDPFSGQNGIVPIPNGIAEVPLGIIRSPEIDFLPPQVGGMSLVSRVNGRWPGKMLITLSVNPELPYIRAYHTIVLVVDSVGKNRNQMMVNTAKVFLSKLTENDRLSIVNYNGEVILDVEPVTDDCKTVVVQLLQESVNYEIKEDGNLWKGLSAATQITSRDIPRTSIVVLSGNEMKEDRTSILSSPHPIYTVGYGSKISSSILQKIAMKGGGRFTFIHGRKTTYSVSDCIISTVLSSIKPSSNLSFDTIGTHVQPTASIYLSRPGGYTLPLGPLCGQRSFSIDDPRHTTRLFKLGNGESTLYSRDIADGIGVRSDWEETVSREKIMNMILLLKGSPVHDMKKIDACRGIDSDLDTIVGWIKSRRIYNLWGRHHLLSLLESYRTQTHVSGQPSTSKFKSPAYLSIKSRR